MIKERPNQNKKNARKDLIEKMISSEVGTYITHDARNFHKALSDHETDLRKIFCRNSKKGQLSESQIEKIRLSLHDFWVGYYETHEFTLEDLPMIPVLSGIGQEKFARRMLDQVMESPNYDKKSSILRHSRSFEGFHLGDRFVDLYDNLNFAYALRCLGKHEAASKAITFVRDNLVNIKFLEESQHFGAEIKKIESCQTMQKIKETVEDYKSKGFNVEVSERKNHGYLSCYISAKHPEKVSNIEVYDYIPIKDEWARDKRHSKIAGFLFGEHICGNRELAKKVFTSLGTRHCTGTYSTDPKDFEPDSTCDAAKLLILSKLMGTEQSPAAQFSRMTLDKTFIKEWGLYISRRPFSNNLPKMQDLDSYTQLYAALLSLYEGNPAQAGSLVTNAVHAGLYDHGKFIDREICSDKIHNWTNAIAIRVLETLHEPKQLENILFF